MKVLGILLVATLPLVALASFCGEAAIPFSFEVLPDGHPVLGCARPSCFGWSSDASPAGSSSSFYRYNRRADGFFRKQSENPRAITSDSAKYFKPQTAHCSSTFDAEKCSTTSQWVGGIGPLLNNSNLPLSIQCCEYEASKLSEDRGLANVDAGQIVIGGEVFEGSRQFAFDYISNVEKTTGKDGKISYSVAIRRLPCLPYPSEFAVGVDQSVHDEILRRFGGDKTKKLHSNGHGAKAFQAPIFNVVDNNIAPLEPILVEPQVIQGPFIAEPEAIIEFTDAAPINETVYEGILLPENAAPNIINAPAQGVGYSGGSYGGAYYPVSGGSYFGGGGGGGFFCFSADTKVIVHDGQDTIEKRMDELKVDDWVMAGNEKAMVYSRVESWLHRMPETIAEFVHFKLVDGSELKLTNKHYLYRGDCSQAGEVVSIDRMHADMVYADEVTPDQCLFTRKNGIEFVETPIAEITTVKERGIYAPMTHSGNIVANNVYASCYNIIDNQKMQHTFSKVLRNFANSFWAKLWIDEASVDVSEVELIPGMRILVDLLRHVIPSK